MLALATAFSTAWSSFCLFPSASFCSLIFALISALNASNVSNSETSAANSSSSSGSSFTLISCTVHLNTASFPAKSSAWYSAGKVTLTSTSLPVSTPTNCSSNPGMKDPDPIVSG